MSNKINEAITEAFRLFLRSEMKRQQEEIPAAVKLSNHNPALDDERPQRMGDE